MNHEHKQHAASTQDTTERATRLVHIKISSRLPRTSAAASLHPVAKRASAPPAVASLIFFGKHKKVPARTSPKEKKQRLSVVRTWKNLTSQHSGRIVHNWVCWQRSHTRDMQPAAEKITPKNSGRGWVWGPKDSSNHEAPFQRNSANPRTRGHAATPPGISVLVNKYCCTKSDVVGIYLG